MVIATTLLDAHTSFAWFVVVGNGVAGLWALAAHWLEPLRGRALWVEADSYEKQTDGENIRLSIDAVIQSFAEESGLTTVHDHRFMNVFTGFLPYLRLPMTPSFGAYLDALLRPIPLSRFTFVNQLFVARKP